MAEQIIMDRLSTNLWLWNRSRSRLRGTLASLEVWSQLIDSGTSLGVLDWERLNEITLLIIAVKDGYDPRDLLNAETLPAWLPQDLRYVGLPRDIYLVREVCSRLRNFRGKVLIITNPVDVMTTLACGWIPKAQVFGSGISLDEARLKYVLRQNGYRSDEMVLALAGEHGKGLIPIRSLSRALEPLGLKEALGDDMLQQVSEIGVNIVRDLGYTLQDCAVVFARDVAWILNTRTDSHRSLSAWCEPACIGRPLMHDGGKILPVPIPDRDERHSLVKASARIRELVVRSRAEWIEF